MPPDLIPNLFEFGALGVFAAFLIWQHVQMQKRLDKRDAAQAKETEKREEEAKVRETFAREQATEQAAASQRLADTFTAALKEIEAAHDARLAEDREVHESRVIAIQERYSLAISEVRAEGAERLAECLRSKDNLVETLTRSSEE